MFNMLQSIFPTIAKLVTLTFFHFLLTFNKNTKNWILKSLLLRWLIYLKESPVEYSTLFWAWSKCSLVNCYKSLSSFYDFYMILWEKLKHDRLAFLTRLTYCKTIRIKMLEHFHGLRDGDEVIAYIQNQTKKLHCTMKLL